MSRRTLRLSHDRSIELEITVSTPYSAWSIQLVRQIVRKSEATDLENHSVERLLCVSINDHAQSGIIRIANIICDLLARLASLT